MIPATLPSSPYVKPAEPNPNSTPDQVTAYLRWAQADASWLQAWAAHQIALSTQGVPIGVPPAPVPSDPPAPPQPGPTPVPTPDLVARTAELAREWIAIVKPPQAQT